VILYFLLDIDVEQSKVDTAILYMQKQDGSLAKIKSPDPLKQGIINEMEAQNLEKVKFVFVMWEESGGHTINIINAQKADSQDNYEFRTSFPLIADKYPVPALVLITELLCRGHIISKSIDWSIKGINQTVSASEKEKIKIMKNFEKENGNTITIGPKDYLVKALSNNKNKIKIYQLKSSDSTLYFRPSGTSPKVRFYIFGDRDSYLEEIKRVKTYIKQKYI
jgi:phosphomannomutase